MVSFVAKLTRRKTVMTNDEIFQTRLKRCLSTLDISLLGIGHMMGSGIYVISPVVAKKAGPACILSFIIAGFASMLAALAYADFGVRYPRAGSAYSYVYLSVGEFLAFIVGWNVLLENTLALSAVTQSCANYVDSLVNGEISRFIGTNIGNLTTDSEHSFFNTQPQLAVIVIMAIFVVVLMLGTSGTSWVGNVLCGVNMAMLLLILAIGIWKGDTANWSAEETGGFLARGWQGVFSAASMCFYSFGGFDAISAAGEEARNPCRSMPIATVTAMSTVTLLYTGVAASLTLLRNWTAIDEVNGFAEALHHNGVDWAKYMITIGAMCGMSTVSVVTLYTVVRVALSMAEDGLLYQLFAIISPRSQVPEYSMFVIAAIASVIAVLFNIDTIIDMLSIGTLMAYMMVTCGLVMYRYVGTAVNRPLSFRFRRLDDKFGSYIKQRGFVTICLAALIAGSFGISFAVQWNSSPIIMAVFAVIILISSALLGLLAETIDNCDNYKMPLMPWLAVLGVVVDCVLMSALSALTWLRLAVWLTVGCTIYVSYGLWNSRLAEQTAKN